MWEGAWSVPPATGPGAWFPAGIWPSGDFLPANLGLVRGVAPQCSPLAPPNACFFLYYHQSITPTPEHQKQREPAPCPREWDPRTWSGEAAGAAEPVAAAGPGP